MADRTDRVEVIEEGRLGAARVAGQGSNGRQAERTHRDQGEDRGQGASETGHRPIITNAGRCAHGSVFTCISSRR
jgi:hypothetical protein